MKKHPQFILAIDNTFFTCRDAFSETFAHYDLERFFEEVQSYIVVRERENLEKNPMYRQVLPYIVVSQVGDDGVTRYSSYRRTSGVGESRLAGNVSIGYGGHIDMMDIYINDKSVIELRDTIFQSVLRELGEEIHLSVDGVKLMEDEVQQVFRGSGLTMGTKNFILDNSNEVGTVHVGVVFFLQIDNRFTIESGEDELVNMPLLTAKELHESEHHKENWTQFILNELIAQNQ